MERKVLIEKFKEKPILYKVLVEKFIDRKIFYVYVYLDPRKPGEYIYFDDKIKLELKFDYEPFYIGKGFGKRLRKHLSESVINKNTNKHKVRKIKKIIKEFGDIPIIFKLKQNLSEQDALCLERKFVALVGRKDLKKGPLTNLTDAGEGKSGLICTEETKQKLREFNLGKKLSQETKDKMSQTRSNGNIWNFGKKGEDNPLYGRKLSEETKQKGREAKMGEKNPMFGKKASQETRNKMSESHKGKTIKNYKVIDCNGIVYYTQNGLLSFCEIHNLSATCMYRVSSGKQKQHKGWKCEQIIK